MHASPQFTNVQKKLNDNHLVAFIIAKMDIEVGEELLWKYNFSQGYRQFETPPTPSPPRQSDVLFRCTGCVCINPCPSLKHCLSAQILPFKRRAVVVTAYPAETAKENSLAKQLCAPCDIESSGRVQGCKCINPCSSSKNCLTPKEGLPQRTRLPSRNHNSFE